MEVNFSELKQKDVINVADGKHLGKVCNVAFTYPEWKVTGFSVTGSKGFKLTRQEVYLPVKCVVKIGEDVVLVNFGEQPAPPPKPPQGGRPLPPNCPPPPPPASRRSFEEYE